MRRSTSESFSSPILPPCLRFWKHIAPRFVQSSNDSNHLAHHFRLHREFPRLRSAARQRVRLHQQFAIRLMEPSATVPIPNVYKIHRPVMLAGPTFVFNRFISVSINTRLPGRSIGIIRDRLARYSHNNAVPLFTKSPFEVSPLLHHSRKKLCAPRIKCRIKPQRHAQTVRRRRQCVLGLEHGAILEALFQGNIKPAQKFQRIQVIQNCQRVKLVQAGYNVSVFDVCQPADMQDKFRSSTFQRKLVAAVLHHGRSAQVALGLGAIEIRAACYPRRMGFQMLAEYTTITILLRIQNTN